MMRIGFCDDEAPARLQFSALVRSCLGRKGDPEPELKEYAGGEALLLDLEEEGDVFDLLFLDIYMDGINGMETARKIRQMGIRTPLVFLTTSPDFALEGYEVSAAGYLLKPVREEQLSALLDRLCVSADRTRVCIQSERRMRYVFLDEILYAESSDHQIRLHLTGGAVYTSREKLDSLESRLDGRFLRCHQSYLVNMGHVADVDQDFVLKNGLRIPIRTRRRKAAADAYYRYYVQHART